MPILPNNILDKPIAAKFDGTDILLESCTRSNPNFPDSETQLAFKITEPNGNETLLFARVSVVDLFRMTVEGDEFLQR